MAVNVSKRNGNVKNIRSHALNSTKKRQKVNLQTVKIDGKKKRLSASEIRTMKKAS